MSTIFYILEDEYERLSKAEKVYRKAIAKEVKGSAQIKHVGKKDYLYIASRNGNKILYKYAGAINSDKAISAQNSIKKRHKYEQLLRDIKGDLKDVRKALRGKI